ncbi:MAG: 50S ribosomal protein L9 [Bacteroidetes bacterium]|nr:50S ribosomal protein L9 [Bacteroidota bacterium]
MKVILKQEVDGLGTIGDIVKVKDGFARNYLVPQGFAIVATEKNLKAVEGEKKRLAKIRANNVSLAESLKGQLAKVTLNFEMQAGEDGKLFGSVTTAAIADQLTAKGFNIDRRKIVLDHINKVGEYTVEIKLFQEITGEIKVVVESNQPKAEAEA